MLHEPAPSQTSQEPQLDPYDGNSHAPTPSQVDSQEVPEPLLHSFSGSVPTA